MFKEFSRDFIANIIRRLGVSIIFLGSLRYFTEKLSPIEFGNFTVLLFIITLISTLTTSWLTAGYLRFSKDYSNIYSFFNTVFNTHIISIFLGVLLLLPILIFIAMRNIIVIDPTMHLFLILNFIGLSLFNFFSIIYVSNREIKKLGYMTVIQAIIAFLLSVVLLEYKVHLKYIFLSNAISYIILNIYFFLKLIRPEHTLLIERLFFLKIIRYSLPLLLMNLLSLILISGDQILMKFFRLKDEIGIYSANYLIIDKTITLFTSIFTISYIPILFSSWKELGKEATYEVYKKIAKVYTGLIIVLGFIFVIYYNDFMPLLIEKKYLNKNLLIYILLGSIFFNLTNIISEIFTLNQRTDLLALCFLPPVLFNLWGNIILIPRYGVYSAAYLTVISYLFLFLLTSFVAKKYVLK